MYGSLIRAMPLIFVVVVFQCPRKHDDHPDTKIH